MSKSRNKKRQVARKQMMNSDRNYRNIAKRARKKAQCRPTKK